MPPPTPTPSPSTPATRPPTDTDLEPHCVLEVWDTARKVWVADTAGHRTMAEAMAAAAERGVYRIVLVSRGQRIEQDVFAIV